MSVDGRSGSSAAVMAAATAAAAASEAATCAITSLISPWVNAAADIVSKEAVDHETPVEILPWLFLEDVDAAADTEGLRNLGITHVLNVAGAEAAWPEVAQSVDAVYKQLNGEDSEVYPMLEQHWHEAWQFVQAAFAKPDGKVLIHCFAGVNRSGLLATAALMAHTRMPVLEALRHVRSRRGELATCCSTTPFAIHSCDLRPRTTYSALGHRDEKVSVCRACDTLELDGPNRCLVICWQDIDPSLYIYSSITNTTYAVRTELRSAVEHVETLNACPRPNPS